MRRLFWRCICKTVEYLCRATTLLRRGFVTDPTAVLLDHMTEPQIRAAESSPFPKSAPASLAGSGVAVLVPFRDQWQLTKRSIMSALDQSGPDVRLFLIDNGSQSAAARSGVDEVVARGEQVQLIRDDRPFNYSALNNAAAKKARAQGFEWLFLMNNDVELQSRDTLLQMLSFASSCDRPGAIGCTLHFPDGRIQHLFLAPGVKIVAAHPLKGRMLDEHKHAWFERPRPVAAVTAAALLISTEAFFAVGGLDEELATLGQDVDLCLKLQKAGYTNWTLPFVHAVHHESISRGQRMNRQEVARVYQRWGAFLTENPYYSKVFSRWSEVPAMTLGEPAYPWSAVLP